MAFSLDTVVPWGRSFAEYVAMFALSEAELKQRFLGCGDGPAAFNSVLAQRGGRVISADPLYQFSPQEIRGRIEATFEQVLSQTRQNSHEFVWKEIRSVEELGQIGMAAMEKFLQDYPLGRQECRYLNARLPQLPFAGGEFDIALCSHFLFLYSAHLTREFHLAAIREMCRVAREARIFPLLELGTQKSRHLEPVIVSLEREGYIVKIESVSYEFQKGGNQMLRVMSHE